jgi:hypothetical protein
MQLDFASRMALMHHPCESFLDRMRSVAQLPAVRDLGGTSVIRRRDVSLVILYIVISHWERQW